MWPLPSLYVIYIVLVVWSISTALDSIVPAAVIDLHNTHLMNTTRLELVKRHHCAMQSNMTQYILCSGVVPCVVRESILSAKGGCYLFKREVENILIYFGVCVCFAHIANVYWPNVALFFKNDTRNEV